MKNFDTLEREESNRAAVKTSFGTARSHGLLLGQPESANYQTPWGAYIQLGDWQQGCSMLRPTHGVCFCDLTEGFLHGMCISKVQGAAYT